MILVYLLFALTVTTVLTAFISARIPQGRKGDIFIGLFVVIMLLAWATDQWLLPSLAAGLRTSWPLVLTMVVFVTIFAVSLALSVRTPGLLRQAVVNHDSRLDTEAAVFDLLLWLALLIVGITIMRAIML
jgi:hypothetical protein